MIYLSLGSNEGDRANFLKEVKEKLASLPEITLLKASSVYETQPWPQHSRDPKAQPAQPDFLNQALALETSLSPEALLQACQSIEKEMGRNKKNHWGPRVIDIDILLYHDKKIDLPDLEIPHSRMKGRQFVLVPLLEITPGLKDPVSGQKYIDILSEIEHSHNVKKVPNCLLK